MKKNYRFRMVKYGDLTKCYYQNEAGKWKVTGVNVPDDLKKRGLTVSVEEVTEKEHKDSIKNDEPTRSKGNERKKPSRTLRDRKRGL